MELGALLHDIGRIREPGASRHEITGMKYEAARLLIENMKEHAPGTGTTKI